MDARSSTALVEGGEARPAEVARLWLERAQRAPARSLLAVADPGTLEGQLSGVAERLRRGDRLPLAGVPVAHKDLLDTLLFATSYGHPALAGQPRADAVAVARLAAAGAVQVGKANLHELAYGVTGVNPHTGTPDNPAAPGRVPGGSSSGSAAAVAAGAVVASLGSDTGGSLRIPAACCAVVGVKPTRGAVPTAGVLPLSWLQDTVGPIAATVADAGLVLACAAGHDPADPASRVPPAGWDPSEVEPSAEGLTVLVVAAQWKGRVAAGVAASAREGVAALAAAGASVRAAEAPLLEQARRAQAVLLGAHALAVHGERLARSPEAFGADVRARLERSRTLSAVEVVEALRTRERWRAWVAGELRPGTVVAAPTVPIPPPHLGAPTVAWDDGEEEVTAALTRHTAIWNLAGVPAVSVPCGRDGDGLPVGLQLAGRWWSEPTLLRAAAVVEAEMGGAVSRS